MAKSRTIKSNLIRTFDKSAQPVYLLDRNRRIVYANAALVTWTGIEEEKLTSLTCNYHSENTEDSIDRIAAALCPAPQAFQGESGQTTIEFVNNRGETCKRNATFFPLVNSEGTTVLAIVETEETAISQSNPIDELHQELRELRLEWGEKFRLDYFVGKSSAAMQARRKAIAAARAGAESLVIGPPGSGRQFLCRAIHHSSSSHFKDNKSTELFEGMFPLIPVDCPISDSELIQASIKDLFRLAEDEHKQEGRLLLLEADQLPESAQRELLGFLGLPNFNVGCLSTSSVSLTKLADEGKFDTRLAQFLSTIEIELPSLNDRAQDIPLLAQMFLENFNAKGKQQHSGFAADAVDAMIQYPWPGNVEELRNFVFEACEATDADQVPSESLPERIRLSRVAQQYEKPSEQFVKLDEFLEQIEMRLVARALDQTKGNKSKAAQLLNISRQRIIRWSDKLGPTNAIEENGRGNE